MFCVKNFEFFLVCCLFCVLCVLGVVVVEGEVCFDDVVGLGGWLVGCGVNWNLIKYNMNKV